MPEYNQFLPLGEGGLSIDPMTGELSGMPTVLGSFLVGICVREYRNGVLLSTVLRDYVLNIVPCEALVHAQLDATTVSPQNYTVTSCSPIVDFNNTSTQLENINTIEWSFKKDNTALSSNEWSPTVSFPEGGVYQVLLVLNADEECSDTASIVLFVTTSIESDFQSEHDTCISGPVSFYNNSKSDGTNDLDWLWSFGDGFHSEASEPIHTYFSPGSYDIQLKVTDSNGCEDSITKYVDWQPAPAIIILEPTAIPFSVKFDNLSWPIDLLIILSGSSMEKAQVVTIM